MSFSRMEQDRQINMGNPRKKYNPNSLMDRELFEAQSKTHKSPDTNKPIPLSYKDTKFGEITGQPLELSDNELGMPIRSSFSMRRDGTDPRHGRNDFDLFAPSGSKFDVSYNDPVNPLAPAYSQVNSGNEKVIPEAYGLDPGSFISPKINSHVISLFSLMINNSPFCISPYGLFNSIIPVYYGSSSNTENELVDYFTMGSKDNMFDGLKYIKNELNKFSKIPGSTQNPQLITKSMVFIDKNLNVNQNLARHLADIIEIYPIDPSNSTNEAANINGYINKMSGGLIGPISKNIIGRANILCTSFLYIKPEWAIPFEKSVDGTFNGNPCKYLTQHDTTHEYFEDNIYKLTEFVLKGNIMSMGIIKTKSREHAHNFNELTSNEINIMIKNLKPQALNRIMIPIFTQQIKLKLTNLLTKTGLVSVFENLNVPELIEGQEPSNISDIIQNITVIVANTSGQPTKKHDKAIGKTRVDFVVSDRFVYYFRLLATNTIILLGYY